MNQEFKKSPDKKSAPASNSDFCHIGDSFHLIGTINGAGLCVISGVVEGAINTAMVRVNQGAKILGEINCTQLDVAGNIQGKVTAEDIFLRASAGINGNLSYRSIVIEKGAEIEGNIRRTVPSSINAEMEASNIDIAKTQGDITHSDSVEQYPDVNFYLLPFPAEIQELMVDAKKMGLTLDDGMDHPELFELQETGVLVNYERFKEHISTGGSNILKLMVDDKIFTLNIPMPKRGYPRLD